GGGESGVGNGKSLAIHDPHTRFRPNPHRCQPTRFYESRFPTPHSRPLNIMNRKGDKSLIVALDIGTSRVKGMVGQYPPAGPVEVIGIGSHASNGLKRGVVVDIESTVNAIQRAIEEAESIAACEIRSVYASISGSHTHCLNSPGIVPIRDG